MTVFLGTLQSSVKLIEAPYVFDWENAISLPCNAGESGLISWRRGSLMGFVELQQDPGVYSPVMAGMSIRNLSLFSEVSTPV